MRLIQCIPYDQRRFGPEGELGASSIRVALHFFVMQHPPNSKTIIATKILSSQVDSPWSFTPEKLFRVLKMVAIDRNNAKKRFDERAKKVRECDSQRNFSKSHRAQFFASFSALKQYFLIL